MFTEWSQGRARLGKAEWTTSLAFEIKLELKAQSREDESMKTARFLVALGLLSVTTVFASESAQGPSVGTSQSGRVKKKVAPVGESPKVKAMPAMNPSAGSHGKLDPSAGSQMSVGVEIPLSQKKKKPIEAPA